MESWTTGTRILRGAGWAAGLGAVAGAVESAVVAGSARGAVGVGDAAVLGLVGAFVMAAVAGLVGVLLAPVHTVRANAPAYRRLALQVGLVAGVLTALYQVPWALDLWADDRRLAAGVLAAMPLGTAWLFVLNTRFVLARVEADTPLPVPWAAVWGGGTVLALVAGMAAAASSGGSGGFALPGDPNVVVITTRGLRLADLSDADTPALEALASRGTTWTDAATPSTATVGALGSLWTGIHPLRHRAVDDLHALPRGWRTVPEVFAGEGFATGLFAGTAAVRGVGLDQGFGHVDDRFTPGALGRLTALSWLAPRFVRRDPATVVTAATTWIGDQDDKPFLAWVALGPVTPAGLDAAVAEVVDVLDATGATGRTMIVVVGAHGVRPGGDATDLRAPHTHVPMLTVTPGKPHLPQVGALVRVHDVAPTMLAFAGLEAPGTLEGLDLLGFGDGRRERALWTSITGVGADGDLAIALRDDGAKVVFDLAADDVEVYDVAADPDERRDLAVEQATAIERAESLLAPDVAALARTARARGLGRRRAAVVDALEGR